MCELLETDIHCFLCSLAWHTATLSSISLKKQKHLYNWTGFQNNKVLIPTRKSATITSDRAIAIIH